MKPLGPGENQRLSSGDRQVFIRGLPKAELHIHIDELDRYAAGFA